MNIRKKITIPTLALLFTGNLVLILVANTILKSAIIEKDAQTSTYILDEVMIQLEEVYTGKITK
jgi:hypothetical protein